MDAYKQLDASVRDGVEDFKRELTKIFGDDLCAVYLIGSAAEARVRMHSDVNLIVILNAFSQEKAMELREAYRIAKAAVNLSAMFVLKAEVEKVVDAFPVKFVDVKERHVLLCGKDVLSNLSIPREKLLYAVTQSILNTRLRLRERFVLVSLREEQLIRVISESAGSLRACAASLLYLEGKTASSPREALQKICAESSDKKWVLLLEQLSSIREKGSAGEGNAEEIAFELMGLADLLSERLAVISEKGNR